MITHVAARVGKPPKFATAWVICLFYSVLIGGDLLNVNNSPPQEALLRENDLHPYQAVCVDFIEQHPACALFLDCGLGKTAIALTAINRMMFDSFEVCRVLIIAPLRVARDTWPAELSKWAHLKNLRMERVIGTQKERVAALSR